MVDEFQDTDPVQWQVIDRAFTGRSTLILIGDPKQAIYAFRGGDIVTYLKAARDRGRAEDARHELAQRRRAGGSAAGGAAGRRTRRSADHRARRRRPPHRVPAGRRPVRRPVPAAGGAPGDIRPQRNSVRSLIDELRTHIPADLAADIGILLASGATFDGEPVGGGRHRGDRREAQGRPRVLRRAVPRRASLRSTPATPTSSPPTPPRTGWHCWRRSTSRTARAWCGPRRRRCSSARLPSRSSTAATS